MATAPAISFEQVTKQFGAFTAVNQLSFEVPQGALFGFLGPNGSGKSTSLRMILDLIRPTDGRIQLFGESLSQQRSRLMMRVGSMIEKPDFYTYLPAHTNLELAARAFGINYSKAQYEALYKKVGLWGRQQDKVKTYSHGMKQRLGIAQALLHNPDMIILDEPNTGLDPQGIIDLRHLMLQLNREEGKTIVFSSHILSEVQAICTDLVVIHRGQKKVEGKVSELLSNEQVLVHVELNDSPEQHRLFAETTWYEKQVQREADTYALNLPKEAIPLMLNDLGQRGITVYRVDYRNPLEDYFLKLTGGNL
ncbi:MAG: ABC transporter ATP-binding protein [Chitinophagaceae bacterium]